jgi:bis(5'-nucleosidyl)-tetraphosphatase
MSRVQPTTVREFSLQEFSAGIIPLFKNSADEYECLIIQHSAGAHWDFPKGHIEKGEEALQAAQRELVEETGLQCASLIPAFSSFIYYSVKRDGVPHIKEVQFFAGFVPTQDVTLSVEHTAYKWVPLADAHTLLTYAGAQEVSKQLNVFLRNREYL